MMLEIERGLSAMQQSSFIGLVLFSGVQARRSSSPQRRADNAWTFLVTTSLFVPKQMVLSDGCGNGVHRVILGEMELFQYHLFQFVLCEGGWFMKVDGDNHGTTWKSNSFASHDFCVHWNRERTLSTNAMKISVGSEVAPITQNEKMGRNILDAMDLFTNESHFPIKQKFSEKNRD